MVTMLLYQRTGDVATIASGVLKIGEFLTEGGVSQKKQRGALRVILPSLPIITDSLVFRIGLMVQGRNNFIVSKFNL